jgi:transposase
MRGCDGLYWWRVGASAVPPGYRRKEPAKRPKLWPRLGVIDTILEEDKTKPAKQRHTAKRIFDHVSASWGPTLLR